MRVVVFGGRDYSDRIRFYSELDTIHHLRPIFQIISGGASGADSLAIGWACSRKVAWISFTADWKRFGCAAGSRRNQQMIDEGKPDLAVAFPGGTGTADMTRRVKKANIELITIK